MDQQENWRRRLGAGCRPASEDGMEMTNGQTIKKVADGRGVEDLTASKADTKVEEKGEKKRSVRAAICVDRHLREVLPSKTRDVPCDVRYNYDE
uniref:Uncharacterized protein n=1 Tax=Oryza glaberrima TaxID=4538 RepID=I1QA59_ORYGL